MAEYTREQLLSALRKADAAGDINAAKVIARRIANIKTEPREDTQQNMSTSEAGAPVPHDDPYFLPTEEGFSSPMPKPKGVKKISDMSALDIAIGAAETGLSSLTGATTGLVSGAAGGLAGMLGDLANVLTPEEAQELQRRWAAYGTYEPKTEAGRMIVGDIAEATGSLPPVTGYVAPRVRVGKKPIPEILPEQEQRAVRFSGKTGSPIMESDITPPTTFAGKAVRGVAEKVPILGTGKSRAKQQEARQSAISEFTEGYEPVTEQDLYNSLIKSKDKKSEAVSKRYNDIGDKMGDTIVTPTKTISTIDNEIADLQKAGKVQSPEVIAQLEKLREQLSAGDVNYNDMRNNRTIIRETLKSDESKTISDRVINKVYSAMTDDIQSQVESTLGSESANKLKQADRLLYSQYNDAKKTKLKNVLNKGDVKPEEVTKMLFSSDVSDISKLYRELNVGGRDKARSLIVGRMKQIFDETESPERFLQKANQLKKQTNVFFKGDQKEVFLDLLSYLKQTKQAAKSGVYNENGQQLMSLITIAPVADIAGAGGVATGAAATIGLVGRAIENRKVRSALRKLKQVRPHTPDYNQALIALDNAVNEINQDPD